MRTGCCRRTRGWQRRSASRSAVGEVAEISRVARTLAPDRAKAEVSRGSSEESLKREIAAGSGLARAEVLRSARAVHPRGATTRPSGRAVNGVRRESSGRGVGNFEVARAVGSAIDARGRCLAARREGLRGGKARPSAQSVERASRGHLARGKGLKEGGRSAADGHPQDQGAGLAGHNLIGQGLTNLALTSRDLVSRDFRGEVLMGRAPADCALRRWNLRSGALTGRASMGRDSISRVAIILDSAAGPTDKLRAGRKADRASRSGRRGTGRVGSRDRTSQAAPDGRSRGLAEDREGLGGLVRADAVVRDRAEGGQMADASAERSADREANA
jgi:hypothetical protein